MHQTPSLPDADPERRARKQIPSSVTRSRATGGVASRPGGAKIGIDFLEKTRPPRV